MTPMKAIREKCLDCMCGSYQEVRLCPCQNCPLYAYRFGKRPKEGSYTPSGTSAENTPPSPAVSGQNERKKGETPL